MGKLLVSEDARREFANLRRAFNEVNEQLQTKFSQEPEPIDWEYYRKGIGPRLVDMYKETYERIEEGKKGDTRSKSGLLVRLLLALCPGGFEILGPPLHITIEGRTLLYAATDNNFIDYPDMFDSFSTFQSRLQNPDH